ncbi:MAG: esterase-like activity of phytase family protein [Planctomycetes bacterium]|nr:esterase-like activity of phytase family protein [Planctomycetota bacterium]
MFTICHLKIYNPVFRIIGCLIFLQSLLVGCQIPLAQIIKPGREDPTRKEHILQMDSFWRIDVPDETRMDLSGLVITNNGRFLTIDDKEFNLFELRPQEDISRASIVASDLIRSEDLVEYRRTKVGLMDCEGLAVDADGNIYICEEQHRWIFKVNSNVKRLKRLKIDWSPVTKYFNPTDKNASFEGVAVSHKHLFVINERDRARIIVVDLASLKVLDHFTVYSTMHPSLFVHYSGLSWFDGKLYILLRHSQVILEIDPETHRVIAEYSFRNTERESGFNYRSRYWTGCMEGLHVSNDFFWVLTDNNGNSLKENRDEDRPTLIRFKRPEHSDPVTSFIGHQD